jgi:protein transport protein SEC24
VIIAANGEIVIIWLGSALSPQVLRDLYGVEHLDDLDVRMASVALQMHYAWQCS